MTTAAAEARPFPVFFEGAPGFARGFLFAEGAQGPRHTFRRALSAAVMVPSSR